MGRREFHRRSCNEPGHAHELTFTCYHNYPFLASELTCGWLVESIEAARMAQGFALWAFVFMPDHVHLIVWPRRTDYSVAMILKAIKAPVARRAIAHLGEHRPEWLPRVTRRRGGRDERLFWQSGGGYDRNIDEPRTLMRMIDYVHNNPIRRGLADRPSDWRWSSARWYDGQAECSLIADRVPPEWVPIE